MFIPRLLLLATCLLAVSFASSAQVPTRVPANTGFTSGLAIHPTASGSWIVDGATVYRGGPDVWSPFPALYQCGPARMAFATDTLISVVANRFMASDTSWWMFTGDRRTMRWTDSVRLDAVGQFLCATTQHLLFSSSDPDAEMWVDVYGRSGSIETTFMVPNVRNTSWVMARMCGDSVIITDPTRGVPVYMVVRNVDASPSAWTVADLPDVRFGIVGANNGFVFQTDNGVFLDEGGTVKPLTGMSDRLQDLIVDGRQGARIAQGGIEYMRDLTVGSPLLEKATTNLFAGNDRLLGLGPRLAYLWRGGRNLDWFRTFTDASGSRQSVVVAAFDGSVSRGSRYILSGENVTIADLWTALPGGLGARTVATFMPPVTGDTLRMDVQRGGDPGTVMLAHVGDEVWLGTQAGVLRFPDGASISNRNGYLVASSQGANGPVYMLTDRGVEVREQASAPWRVVLPDYIPTAMAVCGDSLILLRVEDISSETPEARYVVDAYDMLGNPFFAGVVVVDSAVSKGLVFRSMTLTPAGLLINGTTGLFRSVDAGASWVRVEPGVRLTTPLQSYDGTTVAWAHRSDGTQGPALMITPDRWVMQPVLLRSAAPAEVVATMPGWFVFSTSDGVWSVRQTISSVDSDVALPSAGVAGEPDETVMFDLSGRIVDNRLAVSGAYFLRQRYGTTWVTKPILHIR